MIKAPKNREEYLVRCVDLHSIKPSSEYWARRVQLADVYIYKLEDKIRELTEKAERLRNDNLQLIEQIGGGE